MSYVSISIRTTHKLDFFKRIAERLNVFFKTSFVVERFSEFADKERYTLQDVHNKNVRLSIYSLPAFPPDFPFPLVSVSLSIDNGNNHFTLKNIIDFCRAAAKDIENIGISSQINSPSISKRHRYTIEFADDKNAKLCFDKLSVYCKELIHNEPFVVYENLMPLLEGFNEIYSKGVQIMELATNKIRNPGFGIHTKDGSLYVARIGFGWKEWGFYVTEKTLSEVISALAKELRNRGYHLVSDQNELCRKILENIENINFDTG